jgi:hypothetical protein
MDTINTIIKNAQTLSNTPIDWSLNGGVVWFLMMVAGVVVIALAAWVSETRQERRLARQELYRKAGVKANIRLNRMERQGFQEIV